MDTIITFLVGTILTLLGTMFVFVMFSLADMMLTGGLIGNKIQKWFRRKLGD